MATLVKYKDQVTVNLDNVSVIKVDEVPVATQDGDKFGLRFHTNDGFERHWAFDTREEALEVEAKMVSAIGKVIEL